MDVSQLVLMKGSLVLTRIDLEPGFITIGRSREMDITIEDENVTRQHARIQVDVEKKIFLFEDLNSLNGSFINNIKVQKKILQKDDTIQLGLHHIIFTREEL